ncbi:MAG: hypothetical protein KGM42_02445 [Hyphomicrobiales bacterium]|nr:hypothetical protein [Hyphomicrobiales bacterium]
MIDPFWISLAAKMATTAVIVVAASMVVERSGPFIGAMVATLPISAGPAYVFLAAEHGGAFIAQASLPSLAINAVTFGFGAIYARLAQTRALPVALGAAAAFWLVGALVVVNAPWTLARALVLNAVIFAFAYGATRACRAAALTKIPARRWWDVPFRATLVMCLVGLVVGFGRILGPAAAGVAALVPIVMTSLAIILQPRIGGPGAAAVLSHALPGLVGFGLAVAALHIAVIPLGVAPALALALAICVGWNAMLMLWRRYSDR